MLAIRFRTFSNRFCFSATMSMSPILTPSLSTLESPSKHIRRVSTSSVKSFVSVIASASSVSSIPSGEPEVVKAEGLRHASFFLEAR